MQYTLRALGAFTLVLIPAIASAGASVWVPNGAVAVQAEGSEEPEGSTAREGYPPWNAIDGDPKTTYVTAKGEVLQLRLGGKAKVHHVELLPGYAKNPKVWRGNQRPTKVRVRTGLGDARRPWKVATYDPPNELGKTLPWWSISLEPAVEADTIEIEVLESEEGPGNRSPDVCISEVVLLSDKAPATRNTYHFDVPLSDDRLAMPFERLRLQDGRCRDLEHDNTGGALTKFVGACQVVKGELRLDGRLEIHEPMSPVETEPLKARYTFRRVNSRVLLIDGYVYSN